MLKDINDNSSKYGIKATNPYSGQSTMLTPEEHKLYIEIKTAEFDEDYNTMQKKLSKFSRTVHGSLRLTELHTCVTL